MTLFTSKWLHNKEQVGLHIHKIQKKSESMHCSKTFTKDESIEDLNLCTVNYKWGIPCQLDQFWKSVTFNYLRFHSNFAHKFFWI